MDLNELYARHQRLLMRAEALPTGQQRSRWLVSARACARRITRIQQDQGAPAASDWARLATAANAALHFPRENIA